MNRSGYALLFIAGVVIFLAVFYLPSYQKYHELEREYEKINQAIEQLEANNIELREEARLLQTDLKYLEKVLREELGMVKPGEVVYKFVRPSPQNPGTGTKNPKPAPGREVRPQ